MAITLHRGDLPPDIFADADAIAVDTETLGLRPHRDALCLVQLSAGDGNAHLVQLDRPRYGAPNLKALLADPAKLKIFHFARFDVAVIKHFLGVDVAPLFCTKIASRLVRTYAERHGLKDLCRELLGIDLSKQQQTSDWGADKLSEAQLDYAASDVLHLHALKDRLEALLEREGRTHLAKAHFAFLPTRAELDLIGWQDEDLFSHS